jgi:hypothetical protein
MTPTDSHVGLAWQCLSVGAFQFRGPFLSNSMWSCIVFLSLPFPISDPQICLGFLSSRESERALESWQTRRLGRANARGRAASSSPQEGHELVSVGGREGVGGPQAHHRGRESMRGQCYGRESVEVRELSDAKDHDLVAMEGRKRMGRLGRGRRALRWTFWSRAKVRCSSSKICYGYVLHWLER